MPSSSVPNSTPPLTRFDLQGTYLQRARASVRETLTRQTQRLRSLQNQASEAGVLATLQTDLEQLATIANKLEQGAIRIAAFGLVSRGKSAVLNALLNQPVFQTGAINGVTQWPRSVQWLPKSASANGSVMPILELIDTPGLDEVDGQTRAQMAIDVVHQADLILFVVSGDITRTEYQALCQLRSSQKPLLLVFNKIDLYPEKDRQAIYHHLQNLAAAEAEGQPLNPLLSLREIVMVAAAPAPIQVRVEWADGRVSHEWETPVPQIDELKEKLLEILNREGQMLLAVNALRQVGEVEATIAHKTMQLRKTEAERLIWNFARYKALAIALNPIAFLDVLGGTIADLAMIRSLARLHSLPMTRYEAGKLWRKILLSSGSLLVGELGSSLFLGLGKSAAAVAGAIDGSAITTYIGVATTQAALAGYGTYAVGRATQAYLEQGCTWGPQGADTIVQDILSQVEPHTILYRLKQELQTRSPDG